MGLLDQAIEATPSGRTTLSNRVDRVLDRLSPHLDLEEVHRLDLMLRAPAVECGHVYLADILRAMAEAVEVDHENLTNKDIEGWRKKQR